MQKLISSVCFCEYIEKYKIHLTETNKLYVNVPCGIDLHSRHTRLLSFTVVILNLFKITFLKIDAQYLSTNNKLQYLVIGLSSKRQSEKTESFSLKLEVTAWLVILCKYYVVVSRIPDGTVYR